MSGGADKTEPKSNFWAIVIGVGLLLVISLFAVDEPVAREIVEAKIVGVHQRQSRESTLPVLIAELENGQRVRLAGSQGAPRRLGKLAKIQRYETSIIGRTHFRFLEYLD